MVGLVNTFYIIGIVYFIVIALSAFFIHPVPEGYLPEQQGEHKDRRRQFTANEAMKTWKFYALWFLLFINITCGIALLSVASPILQETTGMTALAAASIVGVMGLFNGGGRLFWATLSDYFGRRCGIYVVLCVGNYRHAGFRQCGQCDFVPDFLIYRDELLRRRILLHSCLSQRCVRHQAFEFYPWPHFNCLGYGRYCRPCIISWAKEALSTYQSTLFIFALLYAAALVVSAFLLFKLRSDDKIKIYAINLG